MGTTIKLKNSVVQDRIPSAVDIEIGELCVGAHADSPALFFKDHTDNIIKIEPSPGPPANIGNTPPSGAAAGDLWWSTNNGENTLYVYYDDGVTSQWVISVPTSEGGSNFLPLTGGALTGPLTSTSTASFADGDMTVSVDGDIFLGALDFTSAAGQGSQYYYYGVVKLQRPSTAPANAELIDCYWGTQQAFRVEVDGNMLTAGSITAASTIKNGVTGTGVQLFNDGTIQSWNNGNLNFNVTSGGSITAAGLLTVNNNARIYRPTSKGGNVAGNALLTLDSDVNGVGTSAVSITTDGKITAASTIFSGATVDYGATSLEGSLMGAGSVFIQKSTGNNSSAIGVYQGVNTTPTFSVKGDGSIASAGSVCIGTSTPTQPLTLHGNFIINTANADGNEQRALFRAGGSGDPFSITMYDADATTAGITLSGNGSATFAGKVSAAGFNLESLPSLP